MTTKSTEPRRLQIGNIKLEVYSTGKIAGAAIAQAAAEVLYQLDARTEAIGIIFATGVGQLDTLDVLTSIPDLPWGRVSGFHLDEYLGIPADHPASFRHYLHKHLTSRVQMRQFFAIDGSTANPDQECLEYAGKLRSHNPQLCFLGIGANGHLAFNDPGEADFEDPQDVKIVELDEVSRHQQFEEGWFKSKAEVPERAITLTMPTILRVPKLLVSAPGRRKAHIVKRTMVDPISTACPATILRTHPDVTMYLDEESAAELKDLLPSDENA